MAYTTATILTGELTFLAQSGAYQVVVTYTGNAGEVPVKVTYSVNTTDVSGYGTVLRGQAMAMLNTLNSNAQIAAAITLPKVLDTTTPIPPPTPSVFGSYFAATGAFTPGSTPTDIFTISGSDSRSVTVRQIRISCRQTTAGVNGWVLLGRSTASTGGTSATVAAAKVDPSYPSATAVVRQYTANPSGLGNLVAQAWSGWVASPAPASVVAGSLEQPMLPAVAFSGIKLTGAAQNLAINFGGVALPAGLEVRIVVQWDESA